MYQIGDNPPSGIALPEGQKTTALLLKKKLRANLVERSYRYKSLQNQIVGQVCQFLWL